MICARIELWRIIGGSWLSLSFFVNSALNIYSVVQNLLVSCNVFA